MMIPVEFWTISYGFNQFMVAIFFMIGLYQSLNILYRNLRFIYTQYFRSAKNLKERYG